MIAATRPFAAAGVALMGAGIIAATPAVTPMPTALPQVHIPELALQASIFDIFTFPAYQQALLNEVEFLGIRATGLAQSGQGLVQSALTLPNTVITAVQQTFGGNPLGALDTVENWAIESATATFVPAIAANIEVGQIQLAIQSAALVAQPLALVSLGNGLLGAFDSVSRAFIVATQNFIDALGTFNIGTIVNAAIDGIGDVVGGFVGGGQALVDGIVGAQTLIADALKARPVQPLAPQAGAAAATPVAERDAATVEAPTAAAPTTSGVRAAAAKPARVQRNAVTQRSAAPSDSVQSGSADSAGKAGKADDAPKAAAGRRAAR